MIINKFTSLLIMCFLALGLNAQNKISEVKELEDSFNFIIATDLGRNGYFDQKSIAKLMGATANATNAEFIISSGDTHHYIGVQSVSDPLWMTNFELIYSHPDLQLEWYPLLGNHEYRGNTQAVLDYSKISRRWCMPDRYYTQAYQLKNGESLRIFYIDTTPLIDKYRKKTDKYPDAVKQDIEKQLDWLNTNLESSTEKWKIVVGHHPIYAETSKDESERTDMQNRVDPILKKHNVDMYICGHLHTFQHITMTDSKVDYVVNSSGSLSRIPKTINGTVFCSDGTGFSVFSATDKQIILYMVNDKGEIIHEVKRVK